ncbi:alpha carbonic anhydrase 4-like [Primulina huaijiensis]|uniref:alpha carbonic anhydrase 4-like n=1 Tax=Primulina huaijiensis TaxID=1492673 RepID=UPI003CC700DE
MARLFNPPVYVICLIFTSLFIAINANENEVDNEHPFNYLGRDKKGPKNWGHLNPKWKVCETGKLQSPIDLLDDRVTVLPRLRSSRRNYKPAPAILRNRGHDISVVWKGDAGGIKIHDVEYKLLQVHWHTPSEHTLNGTRFDMELHLVHNNSRGDIAVVGILYKLGRGDAFLEKFVKNFKSVTEEGISLGVVDPWRIKFGGRKYFRYLGSLTIPPCTEGVLWTVLKKVRTVSKDQIQALRDAVDDGFEWNSRPTQELEGRNVYLYEPKNP